MGLAKLLLGPAGVALDELASASSTAVDEHDIVSYYERNGVFPENIPRHINMNVVDSIISSRAKAQALRRMSKAPPLPPLHNATVRDLARKAQKQEQQTNSKKDA